MKPEAYSFQLSAIPLVAVFALVSCAPVGDLMLAAQYHSTVSSLQSSCAADGKAKWLLPPPQIENLLVLASTKNPDDNNGKIIPIDNASSFDTVKYYSTALLHVLPLDRIYMYVGSIGKGDMRGLGGAAESGVYLLEVKDKKSQECIDGRNIIDEGDGNIHGLPPRRNQKLTCLSFRYSGKYEPTEYKNVFIDHYVDSSFKQPVTRTVQELRGTNGVTYAKSVDYHVYYADSANGSACQNPYDLYELFKDTNFQNVAAGSSVN